MGLAAHGHVQPEPDVASLPNGTYTLSVWVKASAAGGQLVARGIRRHRPDRPPSPAATAWTP